jgi:ABC-type nitrate/sulfonate/bicarbonate transport system substrate-binding protein
MSESIRRLARKRRGALRIAGVGLVAPLMAAAAGLLTASPAASAKAPHKVKMYPGTINVSFPFLPITQFYPLELGKDDGIFQKYGLNVNVETVGNSAINAALESGSLQFTITSPPLELAEESGVPIKEVGIYGDHTATYLIAGPGISSVKDLAGKKIGITTPDSNSAIMAKYALHKAGVPFSSVTFVPMGLTMPSSAIISGLADATDGDTTQLLAAQAGLPGTSSIENFTSLMWPSGQIWGYTPWMKAHKQEAAAFLRAFNAAVVRWENDPVAAKAEISKYDATTDQTTINALYNATKQEFNKGKTPVQIPSYKIEAFISGLLRLSGFPQAKNKYAKEGQLWTSEYWNLAFGKKHVH